MCKLTLTLKKELTSPEKELTTLRLVLTIPEKACLPLNKVRPLLHIVSPTPDKVLPTPTFASPTPEKEEPLPKKGVTFWVSGKFRIVASTGNIVADQKQRVAGELYCDYGGF